MNLSYNYTLDLQGIYSNVTCAYDTRSPIVYALAPSGFWEYYARCPRGQTVLENATYLVPPSKSSLGFWACKALESRDSYTLYLRGSKNYTHGIGNITCTLAPFQPAVHSLQYTAKSNIFNFTSPKPIAIAPGTSTELLKRTVMGLGSHFVEAQTMASNLVAETVISLGVESFGLMPYVQNETYLRLYEALIEGILDYEVIYFIQLVYILRSSPN